MKRNKKKNLFIYIFLIALSIIMIWPFFQMLITSFMTYEESISTPPTLIPKSLKLDSYKNVFETIPFLKLYLNSIITTILRVAGTLATCTMSGFALAKMKFKGKKLIFTIIMTIMMVPGQMFSLPQYLTMTEFGWLNSLKAIIIPNMFTAYGIFMMKQFYSSVPNEIIEAAKVDGASPFTIFSKVASPMVLPGVLVLGMQTAIGAWNDLIWPLIVNSDITKLTLPVSISFMKGQYTSDIPSMMAASTMIVFPMIIVYILVQRKFEDTGVSSAVK
jgi:multiple sugar transport system permease protein